MIQFISLFLQITRKRGTYDLSNWEHCLIKLVTCYASKSEGGGVTNPLPPLNPSGGGGGRYPPLKPPLERDTQSLLVRPL